MDGGVPAGAGGGPGAGPLRFRLLHRAIRWECLRVKLPSDVLIVISKDGRSSKPFVFTIHSQQMSHAAQSLDVAADTQEELSEWVAKIREATQNADARVRGCRGWGWMVPFSWRLFLISPKEKSGRRLAALVFPGADARGEDHGAEEEDRPGALGAGCVLPAGAI